MLSPIVMEDFQHKPPSSLGDKLNGMTTSEKLERYRKLLLKEEEIREKLEKVINESNGEAVGRIPRALMQRRPHGEVTNAHKRKMSCPAVRVEVEMELNRGQVGLQQAASPNMARRTSMIPDIRVQPVNNTQSTTTNENVRNMHREVLLEPRSVGPRRRKLSCPVTMSMKKYLSNEDLSDLQSSPRTHRRMSMQPSFAETRAIQAREKLERRRASLKSLEEDVMKAQNVIAVAKALSMTSLAEDQIEASENTEEGLRKSASCVL